MRTILILLFALTTLIFVGCNSETEIKINGENLPELYLAGKDSSKTINFNSCADTTKTYTKCDNTKGVAKTTFSKPDSTVVTFKSQGDKISEDSLLALLTVSNGSNTTSKSFFDGWFSGFGDSFKMSNWFWPIIWFLILVLMLALFWGLLKRLWNWANQPNSQTNTQRTRSDHSETHITESVTSDKKRVVSKDSHNSHDSTRFWAENCSFHPTQQIVTRVVESKVTDTYKTS